MKHGFIQPVLYSFIGAGLAIAGQTLFKQEAPQKTVEKTTQQIIAEAKAATVTVAARTSPSAECTIGCGTGWFIDGRGDIMTADHVVSDFRDKIIVTFADGTKHKAEIVFDDSESDIAIVHVDNAAGHAFLKFGDSGKIVAGDTVIKSGNAFGLDITFTQGIVSSPLNTFRGAKYVQYDAATNSGDSGGPIVNKKGEAIGMIDEIAAVVPQNAGINFAVPSNTLLSKLPAFLKPAG